MLKIKKQNILINNAGAGFLISSTGVIYSTGAWGCSHQIHYSFSFSESLLRIHKYKGSISNLKPRKAFSLKCFLPGNVVADLNIKLLVASLSNKVDFLLIELADINII